MASVCVTGGAGFIGSNLAEALLAKGRNSLLIIDNLSSGSPANLPKSKSASFAKLDIRNPSLAKKMKGASSVFHFAADPSVEKSISAEAGFEANVAGTFNVLGACRKNDIRHLVFASSSTVYGEAEQIPTPETCPAVPISNYGASKLACEAYCASFAHSYGIKSTILRYANIYGSRSTHGVMFDFYNKLKKNPKKLLVLGNGKQMKSYLHISDCISATLLACERQEKICDYFNIGGERAETVDTIARCVSRAMGASPSFSYSGGERGWKGDVRHMLLDISKLKKLGWRQEVSLEKGVGQYIRWLSGR